VAIAREPLADIVIRFNKRLRVSTADTPDVGGARVACGASFAVANLHPP
jgi:hypothetical protein